MFAYCFKSEVVLSTSICLTLNVFFCFDWFEYYHTPARKTKDSFAFW